MKDELTNYLRDALNGNAEAGVYCLRQVKKPGGATLFSRALAKGAPTRQELVVQLRASAPLQEMVPPRRLRRGGPETEPEARRRRLEVERHRQRFRAVQQARADLKTRGIKERSWTLKFFARCLQQELQAARDLFLDDLGAQEPWAVVAYGRWFGPPIKHIFVRKLGDEETAEYLRVEVMDQFRQCCTAREAARVTFPGYLYKMAIYRALKELRARGRRPEGSLGSEILDAVAGGGNPESEASRGEINAIVEACMGELSEEHQRLLRARYWCEAKLSDIDTSAQNAAQKLKHAQQALGRLISKRIDWLKMPLAQRLRAVAAASVAEVGEADISMISNYYCHPRGSALASPPPGLELPGVHQAALKRLCEAVARRMGRPGLHLTGDQWQRIVDQAIAGLSRSHRETLCRRYHLRVSGPSQRNPQDKVERALMQLYRAMLKQLAYPGSPSTPTGGGS